MHRSLVPLILSGLFLLAGCSSVRSVGTDARNDVSVSQVDRALRGKVVRITFRDRREMTVVGLTIRPDSLTWVDSRGNKLRSAPMADVREVSVARVGRGAIAGLFVGALVGAGVGAVRAVSQGDDPSSDPIGITMEEKLRIFPQAHALYASLFTTPLGAIMSGRRVYRFDHAARGESFRVSERK